MNRVIFLLLAIFTVAGAQLQATAGPTHKPIAKAGEKQRYSVSITLTGTWGGYVRMRLALAEHIVTDDQTGGYMNVQASDLKPGVYTATATMLGLVGFNHNDGLTTTTTFDGNNTQTIRIYSANGSIKLISVARNPNPLIYMAIGGATAGMIWEWGPDPLFEDYEAKYVAKNGKSWLGQNTINHIGDTCKIVFYVGPNAASYVARPSPPVKVAPPPPSPASCPRYKEMLAEADSLDQLANTLQTNDEAYQNAVADMLLQGYDSDYARLGLAVNEKDIPNHFAYDLIPKIVPGEGSIVDARKNIVQSIRDKAKARVAIANAGTYQDYGLGDDGYLSKDAAEYFCSRDPKKLSEGAWEGLYKAGYIDYPTYRHELWKDYAYQGFDAAISFFVVGKAWDVAAFAIPKVFARLPFKFRNVTSTLGLSEARELAAIASKKSFSPPVSPIARVVGSMARFGDDDLVYGIYEDDAVANLVKQNGGKSITNFKTYEDANGNMLSAEQFSLYMLKESARTGGQVHFDLTGMRYIKELLEGTSTQFQNKTTTKELLFIRDNWGTFSKKPKFYIGTSEVKPPWLW